MSILMQNVIPRHERRIRLSFTNSLAAAAFTTLSLYVVTNQDGLGVSPNTIAALPVTGAPAVVELAFDQDLVLGAIYQISAVGVPAVDASVTPAGSVELFRLGQNLTQVNSEVPTDDGGALLFGIDIVHDGVDYVEGSDGDLATIQGRSNYAAAMLRALTTDGLPWDASYGAKPRQYVDGALGALIQLRGALIRTALADDRTYSVDVPPGPNVDPTSNAQAFFPVTVTPKGFPTPASIQVDVPTG